MTLASLRNLCALACRGYPHADLAETLRLLVLLSPVEREAAARCYLAVVYEPTIPLRPVSERRSPAREYLNKQAEARRKIEDMRDGL